MVIVSMYKSFKDFCYKRVQINGVTGDGFFKDERNHRTLYADGNNSVGREKRTDDVRDLYKWRGYLWIGT